MTVTAQVSDLCLTISGSDRQTLEVALQLAQEIRGPAGSWREFGDGLVVTAETDEDGFHRFLSPPSLSELTKQVWDWLEDDPSANGFQIAIWRNAALWPSQWSQLTVFLTFKVHTVCIISRLPNREAQNPAALAAASN